MSRSDSPIFVVGAPRSGTTLLAAMLGAHPRIEAGPETLFFGALEAADLALLLDPIRWPGPATDLVCGLHLRDVPVHELYGRDRDHVHASLAARAPSIQAMLESLTAEHAAAHGKARWVEKTPRHLLDVATIRRLWPDARIVRMVRDPRDVALSQSRMPFQSSSVVVNLCQIARFDRASRAFFARDTGAITTRFEDLLSEPERELRRLCAFLGETFVPAMIEGRSGGETLAAPHETWKDGSHEPLDPSRAGRWPTEMDPAVQRFAALQLREQLRAHGYPGAREPRRSIAVIPIGDRLATKQEALVLALAAQDAVIATPGPTDASELGDHDEIVFWGLAGQLGLTLPAGRLAHAAAVARLSALLAARRARGRPAIWIRRHNNEPERPDDPAERDIARVLLALARKAVADDLAGILGVPGPGRDLPPDHVR